MRPTAFLPSPLSRSILCSLLTSICLALSLTSRADTQGDYTYTVSAGKATITDFNQAYAGALSITDTLGGYPVTGIGGWAFSGCSGLTGVTIPAGVTSIGDYAFSGCRGLTAITVEASNPSYISADGVLFNKSQTTLVLYPAGKAGSFVIPDGVIGIGDGAFNGCRGLTGVSIPAGVTSIGRLAFSGCSGLTGVLTIPAGVTSFGDYAFYGCSSLTGVLMIPAGVASIGDYAFYGCSGLIAITVDAANSDYSSVDGVLFDKSQTTLIQYPGGKTGSYVIPASVTSIESGAFDECGGLTGVKIPDGITVLAGRTFSRCSSLTAISANASNPNYSSADGVLFNKSQTTLVLYPAGKAGSYVIPDSVTGIGIYAFDYCNGLTNVTIGAGVTGIGDYAFSRCSGLAGITIPVGVTSIGRNAFDNCSGLTGITIQGNVTSIGDRAFNYCWWLSGLYFEGDAPGIGADVFTNSNYVIVFYRVGATGFGTTFGGRPAVETTALEAALDTEGLVWMTGGNPGQQWFGQIGSSHDGADAAQSGAILQTGGNRYSWLETTVTGPGQMNFWWKRAVTNASLSLELEDRFDSTLFLTGETNWQARTLSVGPGTHTLRWIYRGKDSDCGWVDQIAWTPGVPFITEQPLNSAVRSGESATLSVAVVGDETLTYRWYLGESGNTSSPVSGAVGASFTTPSVTSPTSYWVRVTNAKGSADSRTARVLVGFEVYTLADLQKVGSGTNGWTLDAGYILMNDIDASETAGWIDESGHEDGLEGFDPIGLEGYCVDAGHLEWPDSVPFTGVFDGRGHVVSKLTINCYGYGDMAGMFSSVAEGGVIQNLGLVDINVAAAQLEAVGGLIGRSVGGRIRGCYMSGSVTGGGYFVGGLIGNGDNSFVRNCCVCSTVNGDDFVGGLVGGGVDNDIRRCYVSGALTGSDQDQNGSYFSGGENIIECYSSAAVSGHESCVGGFVGASYDGWSVESSYWDSDVGGPGGSGDGEGRATAQMKQSETFVGWDFTNVWGIAEGISYPYLRAFPPPFALSICKQGPGSVSAAPALACYIPGATVRIMAMPDLGQNEFVRWFGPVADPESPVTTVTMAGNTAVKAVFRAFRRIATVEELQKIGNDPDYPADGHYWLANDIDASATATWNDEDTDETVLEGFMPLEQFEGLFDGNGHTISELTVNRAKWGFGLFNGVGRGAIVCNLGLTDCLFNAWCGGGVAILNYGTISRCYVTGTMIECGDYDQYYTPNAGGLVLWNGGTVSECYVAAHLSGPGGCAGLVGSGMNDASVDSSYWDVDVGISVAYSDAGRSTAQMKQAATFVGWDFMNVWNISEGVGYPYLRPSWTYVLNFVSSNGEELPSRSVVAGQRYGALPEPTRTGYTFGGWWTEAGGTGSQVTETTTVTETINHTLYQKWTAIPLEPAAPAPSPVPYISDPRTDVEMDTTGSYDGYFYGGAANAVRGTLNVKVTDASNGKLTAKATLQKTALSFSAAAWTATEADETKRATLTAKSGETLDLYVRQNRIWGMLSGGTVGETLTLDGGRNRFADKADTTAQALLAGFKGYYTVALPVADSLSASDTVNAAPQGSGYLAVTVGVGGSAKIAGVLADGTKVSQASRLILFDGCGPEACVPFFSPLYSKQGWAGGLLWLMPGGTVVTDRDLGWYVRWEKPGSGPDGFSMLLDADGGYYGTTAALAAGYLFSADAGGVGYHYGSGVSDAVREALPEGVAVANAGGKLSIAKGVKPALKDGAYDYSDANSALVTLSFMQGTGLFKGKFNLYYDYAVKGKSAHKALSVPYAGILTPVRSEDFADGPAGQGHCLVPDNDPAVSAYKIKRSLPVMLEAE